MMPFPPPTPPRKSRWQIFGEGFIRGLGNGLSNAMTWTFIVWLGWSVWKPIFIFWAKIILEHR